MAKLSGSVGLLSEGIHSFLDVVSAGLSYFTVREAVKPADEDHPFGHGKIETLSSLFESLLLVVAAGLIIHEGWEHLQHPAPVEHQGLAMGVMVVSIVASYLVYRHNSRAASETESSALHVNALHFLADVVASVGVLVGLVVLKFTGWLMVDALTAFAVAVYILAISAKQVKAAIFELSEGMLPESELAEIRDLLSEFERRSPGAVAHDLRTRRSGATRHVDFHLVVCGSLTVSESHAVCDEIEAKLLARFPTASVNIHVEPCETERTGCRKACTVFKARGESVPGGAVAR